MKKQTLTLDLQPEFYLLALVSPYRYYRLCYFLNKHLLIDLVLQEPLAIHSGEKHQLLQFHLYEYYDPLEQMTYQLLANKGEGGALVPELKRVDYFLVLQGEFAEQHICSIEKELIDLSFIHAVYQIQPENLRSWQNLLIK
ncbi:MAG: IPExxxVDY family protein [Bacteroidetes bacterium SW_11_45_7]|nr:MAG: IPExxxVDY family protein [Bacteroidetes bacterium SW_11_45_7]